MVQTEDQPIRTAAFSVYPDDPSRPWPGMASRAWRGEATAEGSPYVSDKCILLRRDAVPQHVLNLAMHPVLLPEQARKVVNQELLDRIVGATPADRITAHLAGWLTEDGDTWALYVATGETKPYAIFGADYHALFHGVAQPGDSLTLFKTEITAGPRFSPAYTLAAWRGGDLIAAFIGCVIDEETDWANAVSDYLRTYDAMSAVAR